MQLTELILKKLYKNLSTQETKVFNEWYQDSKNKELFFRLKNLKERGVDISEIKKLNSEQAWSQVLQKYDSKKPKRNILKPLVKYAAVFIGIFTLSYGAYKYLLSTKITEIDPNAITLQLDNGEVKILSSGDKQDIIYDKGNFLGIKKGNKLDYKGAKIDDELVYNTLNIPYGKRFEITLSDGTIVNLNAGSSLKYPVKFIKGKKRNVFLEGEAYFDVSKDKEHPFIVSTSEMDIKVLGTEFNVSAFPEDKMITTVLVEGLVSLSKTNEEEKEQTELKLTPNYKAEWDVASGKTAFNLVDPTIYTSWIEGKLVLKNLQFKNIIKKLERHYNVKIENNYIELNNQIFTASFDIETIEEVLNSFAENKKFRFKIIDNKTIIINQP